MYYRTHFNTDYIASRRIAKQVAARVEYEKANGKVVEENLAKMKRLLKERTNIYSGASEISPGFYRGFSFEDTAAVMRDIYNTNPFNPKYCNLMGDFYTTHSWPEDNYENTGLNSAKEFYEKSLRFWDGKFDDLDDLFYAKYSLACLELWSSAIVKIDIWWDLFDGTTSEKYILWDHDKRRVALKSMNILKNVNDEIFSTDLKAKIKCAEFAERSSDKRKILFSKVYR